MTNPSDLPPSEKPPLDYAGPKPNPNRPAGGVPTAVQVLIGIVVSAASLILPFLFPFSRSSLEAILLPSLITLFVLVLLAVPVHMYWNWRGLIPGIFIGAVLVILLGCGLCAAALQGLGGLHSVK